MSKLLLLLLVCELYSAASGTARKWKQRIKKKKTATISNQKYLRLPERNFY
jgi:hypothetical protein